MFSTKRNRFAFVGSGRAPLLGIFLFFVIRLPTGANDEKSGFVLAVTRGLNIVNSDAGRMRGEKLSSEQKRLVSIAAPRSRRGLNAVGLTTRWSRHYERAGLVREQLKSFLLSRLRAAQLYSLGGTVMRAPSKEVESEPITK